jgi:hypothetical protein
MDVKITALSATFLPSSSEKPIHLGKQEGGTIAAATPQRVA